VFKVIAFLIEILNWLRIALSPTLIGGILGGIVYLNFPNSVGLAIGVGILFTGILAGVTWATNVWKKKGTSYFMSRIHASPDIDEAIKPKEKGK
jgi:hypothetical protein